MGSDTAGALLSKVLGVAVTAALLASFGTTAPARASSVSCDDATYPSTTWTVCEAGNVAISGQNAFGHLDLMLGLFAASSKYQQQRLATILRDPERMPNPNPCTALVLCPIDPRLSDWTSHGGLVQPVLYTSRSGGTISGHVWATRSGPATRPGVVFINGSIVGFDEIYWYVAQTLARAGFVVMTFDVQGEGMSDQLGQAPDATEDAFAGTPFLGLLAPKGIVTDTLGGNGLPFYDGGEDALDFFLSTPAHHYVPRPSTTTGTSHAAKQARRVAAGLDNDFNPLWQLLDRTRIGLSGHSYGAQAASWLTQADPRVDAGVALDNLCTPISPAPGEFASLGAANPDFHGVPSATYGFQQDCFASPPGPAPAITKPVLGLTGDYLLDTIPYLSPPNPLGKSRASLAYSRAGVDTGEVVIRGGTHFEFNDVPIALPATRRGIDEVAWYTTAWFRKYLAHDPAADAMLLTRRWASDATTGSVDPRHDANLFSWHYRSRLDIHRADGTAFTCENLRAGCPGMVAAAADGWPGRYDFVSAANGQ